MRFAFASFCDPSQVLFLSFFRTSQPYSKTDRVTPSPARPVGCAFADALSSDVPASAAAPSQRTGVTLHHYYNNIISSAPCFATPRGDLLQRFYTPRLPPFTSPRLPASDGTAFRASTGRPALFFWKIRSAPKIALQPYAAVL